MTMFEQKSYQQLSEKNRKAAETIYNALKTHKSLSAQKFKSIFFSVRTDLPKDGYYKNWETTERFLKDHGLMTTSTVNGFKFYFATQKCARTHTFENATMEYQYASEVDIDEAIAYQNTNGGLVNPREEGRVIAQNILGLTGKMVETYAKEYEYLYEYFFNAHKEWIKEVEGGNKGPEYVPFYKPEMKYAVLAPFRSLLNLKKR